MKKFILLVALMIGCSVHAAAVYWGFDYDNPSTSLEGANAYTYIWAPSTTVASDFINAWSTSYVANGSTVFGGLTSSNLSLDVVEGWDIVKFSQKDGVTYGYCKRIRPGKDKRVVELSTEGNAYDMLSVFYMLRTLNMEKLKIEGKYRTTVFSGKRKEWVDIKYVGEEDVEMRDGNVRKSFHISFSFTEEGKSKSSDDIDTWISYDEDRIPLKLRGSLPIGEVCVYFKE